MFFFSSLIQVLYYLGVMQWVVTRVGGLLQAVMGTTVCESVNAAGSVFLGMTESPLLIKPYIESLTSSELHAVMATGFATASGIVCKRPSICTRDSFLMDHLSCTGYQPSDSFAQSPTVVTLFDPFLEVWYCFNDVSVVVLLYPQDPCSRRTSPLVRTPDTC